MKRYSHQRITKIKRDRIEDLLKRAEATKVEDACNIQPAGADLIPYPDMNNLRNYTRDYLLKGLTKTYPVKFTEDGQTYLTTIVDGLPLFTKMSKTIQSETFAKIIPFDQPVLTENGILGGNTFAVTQSSAQVDANITHYACYATNPNKERWQADNTKSLPQSITYYNPKPITLSRVVFSNIAISSGEANYLFKDFTLSGSNDNSTWTTLLSTTNTHTSDYDTTVEYGFDITTNIPFTYYKLTVTSNQGSYGELAMVGYMRLEGTVESNIIETSKPGLWLSNLSTPVYNSSAGGFLSNNFIHNNESSFNQVNSDIIGNYAYTFTQRGVIHREAGSSHYDQDSYNQMWSPSALSCISHEAIIIPELLLQQTYTTYQSMVVPADADAQSYDEAKNKTVEYNFIDNNNNDPATTTKYNGRFVGVDWSYELKFTPNGNGSGNNYGSGDDPYVDDGSNGGCIAGTIEYNLLVNGEYVTCTQTVNECMQTDQSFFNTAAPTDDNATPLNSVNGCSRAARTDCNLYEPRSGASYTVCGDSATVPYASGNHVSITAGSVNVWGDFAGNHVIWQNDESCSGNIIAINAGGSGTKNFSSYSYSSGYGRAYGYQSDDWNFGDSGKKVSLVLYYSDPTVAQTGVNIYINMIDLKAQYEANGLPWTGDCSTSRFQFEFSTTKCTSPWCTSLTIAKNVDINDLGDISKLNDVVFSK